MNDQAADKIKKLLRLAKSDNQHEAALALQRAKELMSKHGLSDADIRLSEIKEAASKGSTAQTPPLWFHNLATMVGGCFGCHIYYKCTGYTGKVKTVPVFVGHESHAEIALYAFEVLRRQLERARKDYLATLNKRIKKATKTKRADYFCIGWVHEMKQKTFALVPPTEPGEAIMAYMATKDLKTGEAKVKPTQDTRCMAAAFEGHLAAKDAYLHKGTSFVQPKQIHA